MFVFRNLRHLKHIFEKILGRGRCTEGQCQCMKGFTGQFCEKVDCPDPTCSDHGFCVDGSCICKKGWKGLGMVSNNISIITIFSHSHFKLKFH